MIHAVIRRTIYNSLRTKIQCTAGVSDLVHVIPFTCGNNKGETRGKSDMNSVKDESHQKRISEDMRWEEPQS